MPQQANVSINPAAAETPSDQFVKQARDEVSVTDSTGREILLRKPAPLSKLRFIEALGASTENPLYTNMLAPLMYVASIAGDPVAVPITKREIEALYQRLDEHGVNAVSSGLPGHFGLSSTEADKEVAKK